MGSHQDRRDARAKQAFLALRGPADLAVREAQIQSLPHSVWRGHAVYAITCHGSTGKGPHQVNVPLALLFSLIEIEAYRCPFHA